MLESWTNVFTSCIFPVGQPGFLLRIWHHRRVHLFLQYVLFLCYLSHWFWLADWLGWVTARHTYSQIIRAVIKLTCQLQLQIKTENFSQETYTNIFIINTAAWSPDVTNIFCGWKYQRLGKALIMELWVTKPICSR